MTGVIGSEHIDYLTLRLNLFFFLLHMASAAGLIRLRAVVASLVSVATIWFFLYFLSEENFYPVWLFFSMLNLVLVILSATYHQTKQREFLFAGIGGFVLLLTFELWACTGTGAGLKF